MTPDVRARLRERLLPACKPSEVFVSAYDGNASVGYRTAEEIADAVLDALTDDDLADALGLAWDVQKVPASALLAEPTLPPLMRRRVGLWQPVEVER